MARRIPPLILSVIGAASIAVSGAVHAQTDSAERVAALKERLAWLDARTTRVEDITQIQRLQRAFGYYVDKGYFGEAADLFTERGKVQYGVDGVYVGHDRIRELFTRHGGGSMTAAGPGLPFGRFNMHMQLQPMVTVADDGRTAHARWREWALLGQYQVEIFWGDAVLENDYVKEDGVWKIATMRYYTNFVAPYQGGWAVLKPVRGDWTTDVGRAFRADEPSPVRYEPFPAVYVPAYHYAHDRSAIRSAVPPKPQARPNDALGRLESFADQQALKLARVSSLRAIENLQAMYGYYVDKGLWKEAASLFSDDGTWEFGQRGVYIGPDSVERGLSLMGPEGLERGQLNNYPMLQPIIDVADDNLTAKGRWRSDVMLARDGKGRWGGGVYENEYVNENGTWKISKQHYWVTFWADYDKGFTGDGLIPMEPASKSNPPDAPPTVVYESLPNTYIVPFHFDHPVTGQPHKYLDGGQ
jgi:SnoaL-like domain